MKSGVADDFRPLIKLTTLRKHVGGCTPPTTVLKYLTTKGDDDSSWMGWDDEGCVLTRVIANSGYWVLLRDVSVCP